MQRQRELYKKHYAHAKLLFCFIIITPIALLLLSLLLLLLMLNPPIYFFPCRSQFGPKNNRTFSFTSHLLLFFLSGCFTRVVTKISSCQVNTTSRQGIKQLGISFGSIFLLFSNKRSQGPLS